jgi:hypothetical protein
MIFYYSSKFQQHSLQLPVQYFKIKIFKNLLFIFLFFWRLFPISILYSSSFSFRDSHLLHEQDLDAISTLSRYALL